jgi:2,3-bisphosphoglycerate-dependent phosphoglycerate mutase
MAPRRERVLVLLRHGHSDWNLSNRLTGWTDIPLTQVGLDEGAAAGRRLAGAGFGFDEAHISVLQRCRQTLEAMLGQPAIPVHATWRLNERHYGQLQGMTKPEILARWGEERSRRWWRGYFDRPPALDPDDRATPASAPCIGTWIPPFCPRPRACGTVSSAPCPIGGRVLEPRIAAGRRLLVISHGNTIRALVMHLDRITPEAMERVEIPPGYPWSTALVPISMPWGASGWTSGGRCGGRARRVH